MVVTGCRYPSIGAMAITASEVASSIGMRNCPSQARKFRATPLDPSSRSFGDLR